MRLIVLVIAMAMASAGCAHAQRPELRTHIISEIRAHKTEVALGTIVIVGGVAFVLATGGSGALILAPLAL